MAVGKNKNLSKGKGGKGGKKKIVDPFSKKEWYMVKAPSTFSKKDVGHTLVTKSIGTKIAADQLKGRIFESCLADLQGDEEHAFRKIKLKVEDVQGRNCLTQFYGMDLTSDKLRSLIKKWQSTIEAFVDVKTTDGYVLRMFCIAFTARREGQIKRASYAQSSHIRAIRKKMMDIMTREASSCDLKELVGKLIPEAIGNEIKKGCAGIYPLQNVYIRKVKQIRAPKFDSSKLMEVHGDYSHEEVGQRMDTTPAAAAPAAEETPAEEAKAE